VSWSASGLASASRQVWVSALKQASALVSPGAVLASRRVWGLALLAAVLVSLAVA
jgi:hypothetical protein